MSAIHRVDDIRAMPARKFFPFAVRLFAYDGVMAARARAEERRESTAPARPERPVPVQAPSGDGRHIVPATKTALQADPVLSGLISFG